MFLKIWIDNIMPHISIDKMKFTILPPDDLNPHYIGKIKSNVQVAYHFDFSGEYKDAEEAVAEARIYIVFPDGVRLDIEYRIKDYDKSVFFKTVIVDSDILKGMI